MFFVKIAGPHIVYIGSNHAEEVNFIVVFVQFVKWTKLTRGIGMI